MCGRFALRYPRKRLEEHFGVAVPEEVVPRANIAPGEAVMVIVQGRNGRLARFYRWGLLPGWAKDPKLAYKLINARAESIDTKPAFRSAFKSRRCLIPASGFYEWAKGPGGKKIPHLYGLKDDSPMALAGLWERWQSPDGPEVWSCTIITVAANPLVAKVHDRMPALLPQEDHDAWLNPIETTEIIKPLLRPYPPDRMIDREADPRLNRPGFEPE